MSEERKRFARVRFYSGPGRYHAAFTWYITVRDGTVNYVSRLIREE